MIRGIRAIKKGPPSALAAKYVIELPLSSESLNGERSMTPYQQCFRSSPAAGGETADCILERIG